MPWATRSNCKDCGVSVEEVGHISARGLCRDCAVKRIVAGIAKSQVKAEDYVEHRKIGIIRYAARLIAEEEAAAQEAEPEPAPAEVTPIAQKPRQKRKAS